MKLAISLHSIITASDQQISSDLAGEAVILNVKVGVYYGLNAIGARVWNLIQEPTMVSDILETLLTEYNVERERCEQDLLRLLSQMAATHLIEIKQAAERIQI